MRTDPTFWLLARSGGFLAYLLVTASVLAGLLLKSRPFASLRPPVAIDLHRFLSLLALAATALHGLALLLDTYLPFGVADLLIPGTAPYRPLATALGVVAAELTLAVYLSFSLRRYIKVKNWRRLHWATYAVFALATVHGIAAGSDSDRGFAAALYALAAGSVAAAIAWRTLAPPASRSGRTTVAREAAA